jgi:hypothetical protein
LFHNFYSTKFEKCLNLYKTSSILLWICFDS